MDYQNVTEAEALKKIEAAGLLEKIADMFFKGIGQALDSAAEYAEEMGVLKQINRIPIEGSDGKTYTLKIELSPVRGKDSYYYVDASTDAPGLDVSPLDKKTIRIDNTNMKQFKKTIDDFLEKASYNAQFPEEKVEEINPGEVVGEEAEEKEKSEDSKSDNENSYTEVDKLINEINKDFENNAPVAGAGGNDDNMVKFKIILSQISDFKGLVTISAYVIDKETWKVDLNQLVLEEDEEINLFDEDENVKTFDQVKGEILSFLNDISMDRGISKVRSYDKFNASTTVRATLIKDSKTKEVSMTAINASTDIKSAMDIISDIIDDETFFDSLPDDEEQSFEICEENDDYDVECIDCVDIAGTYSDMFTMVSKFYNKLKTLEWAVGSVAWNSDSLLMEAGYSTDSLLNNIAPWVISHEGLYPVPVSPFGNQITDLDEYKDENGTLSIETIHEMIKAELIEMNDCLDIYYVNLDHEEQKVIDDYLANINRVITYA